MAARAAGVVRAGGLGVHRQPVVGVHLAGADLAVVAVGAVRWRCGSSPQKVLSSAAIVLCRSIQSGVVRRAWWSQRGGSSSPLANVVWSRPSGCVRWQVVQAPLASPWPAPLMLWQEKQPAMRGSWSRVASSSSSTLPWHWAHWMLRAEVLLRAGSAGSARGSTIARRPARPRRRGAHVAEGALPVRRRCPAFTCAEIGVIDVVAVVAGLGGARQQPVGRPSRCVYAACVADLARLLRAA